MSEDYNSDYYYCVIGGLENTTHFGDVEAEQGRNLVDTVEILRRQYQKHHIISRTAMPKVLVGDVFSYHRS